MSYIIKILKLLEDPIVLIDGITEIVRDERKRQKGRFPLAPLAPLRASLVQTVILSVVKVESGKGFRKAGREHINKLF